MTKMRLNISWYLLTLHDPLFGVFSGSLGSLLLGLLAQLLLLLFHLLLLLLLLHGHFTLNGGTSCLHLAL